MAQAFLNTRLKIIPDFAKKYLLPHQRWPSAKGNLSKDILFGTALTQ